MSRHFPWTTLGIAETQDRAAIRKAYADALRGLNVDEDIAGYANLRRARDEALWLAAQGTQADDGDFGLGGLDEDGEPGPDASDGWQDAPELYGPDPRDDTPPADLPPEQTPDLTAAQSRAQNAWQALLDLLYPGGEASEDSVTYAEMEEGLAHLAILLDHTEQADLVEHDALDGALADVFARTWPRSAPFVEPANAALHWLDEAGSLEERPALMFLNQRIKGMQFHDKVQQPDHPLHKAWIELSRSGRAGVLDRLRVKRLEVDKLLKGIRERFPELESYLDPQRVASWEGESASAAEGKTRGGGFSSGIWVLIAIVAVFRVLVPIMTDDAADKPGPASVAMVEKVQGDLAAAYLFGDGVDMAEVKTADAILAGDLRKTVKTAGFDPDFLLAFGRRRALQAGAAADFEGLLARGELKRLWLAAALGSPEQCRAVLRGDFATQPVLLDEAGRQREQAMFKQMLDARALGAVAHQEGGSFSVPGWVVEQTTRRSGLSPETVSAALRDPDHAARCAMELAMLEVMLKEPGKVPVELLRGL